MAKDDKSKEQPNGTPPAAAAPAPAPETPAIPSWTIKTANAGFRGERFGVRIFDGVGTTTDPKAAAACKAIGYTVEGPALPKAPAYKAT